MIVLCPNMENDALLCLVELCYYGEEIFQINAHWLALNQRISREVAPEHSRPTNHLQHTAEEVELLLVTSSANGTTD